MSRPIAACAPARLTSIVGGRCFHLHLAGTAAGPGLSFATGAIPCLRNTRPGNAAVVFPCSITNRPLTRT